MRMAGYILLAVVVALGIGILSIMFAGAGHGWNSSFYAAIPSLVGAPLAAISWACTRKISALAFALVAIVVGLGTDVYLFRVTLQEGAGHFERAWKAVPLYMTLWFLLFAGWQAVAVAAALKRV